MAVFTFADWSKIQAHSIEKGSAHDKKCFAAHDKKWFGNSLLIISLKYGLKLLNSFTKCDDIEKVHVYENVEVLILINTLLRQDRK